MSCIMSSVFITRYWSLDQVRQQIRFNIQKVIWTLKATHQRRLLIDLLSSTQLQDLLDATMVKAKAHHH